MFLKDISCQCPFIVMDIYDCGIRVSQPPSLRYSTTQILVGLVSIFHVNEGTRLSLDCSLHAMSWKLPPGSNLEHEQGSPHLFPFSDGFQFCTACCPMPENCRFTYLTNFVVVRCGRLNLVSVTRSWPKREILKHNSH